MEILPHGNHSHCFFGPFDGGDGLAAGGAQGGEQRVVVVDAVDFGVHVDGEGDAVEADVAHAATETTRVVGLAHRLEDLQFYFSGGCHGFKKKLVVAMETSDKNTVSMMRWPQMEQRDAVCWNPQ